MSEARLPDAARASVASAKVRDYLLAPEHPGNGGKAGFFARFGFTRDGWHTLRSALRAHPAANPVLDATPAAHGTRVRVRCHLTSPDGRNPCITTVWAIEEGQPPRLITALPGPRGQRSLPPPNPLIPFQAPEETP